MLPGSVEEHLATESHDFRLLANGGITGGTTRAVEINVGGVSNKQIRGAPRACRDQRSRGAADDAGAAVERVGVDHGGAHVFVAKQFLNGADVVAVFQQLGGEGMPQRVGGDGLDPARSLQNLPATFPLDSTPPPPRDSSHFSETSACCQTGGGGTLLVFAFLAAARLKLATALIGRFCCTRCKVHLTSRRLECQRLVM